MNIISKPVPSFGELLARYNRHIKYSDSELANKINVSVRDIIIPKDDKCPTDITVFDEGKYNNDRKYYY